MSTEAFDVVVIGAGLLGCFTARNLKRYNLSVAVLEKTDDVCLGMSKANTAVIYAGYDNRPGSMKAEMCVSGNAQFGKLCEELDVQFSRCGSIMLAYGSEGEAALRRKLAHGTDNGVPGLELVSAEKAKSLEPSVGDGVTLALYAPSTGTVNPWELGIAAYENAAGNGCEFFFGTGAVKIDNGTVYTDTGREIKAGMIVDCTGISSGRLSSSRYYSVEDGADYLIVGRQSAGMPRMIVFEQSEIKCRGLTAVPTVEGSLLLGPTHREPGENCSTSRTGIEEIKETAAKVFPGLEMNIIRSFAGLRPNVETADGEDVHDFVIEEADNIISLIGIKTPGLTCADKLGQYVASLCAERLSATENTDFNPVRKGIVRCRNLSDSERNALIKDNPDYGEIVCLCEEISRAEIIEAVRRGAKNADQIKRRCGAMMGFCQGTRCYQRILDILEECNA